MQKKADFDQRNITVSLGVFIAVSLGIGSAIGIISRPDDWYFKLESVLIVPPQWVISVGWSVYFIAIGIVGHGLWQRSKRQRHWRWSFWVWCVHVVLMWSALPILYLAHRPGVASVIVIVAAGMMFDLGLHIWRRDPRMAQYIAVICIWLTFLLALCFQFTVEHLSEFGFK